MRSGIPTTPTAEQEPGHRRPQPEDRLEPDPHRPLLSAAGKPDQAEKMMSLADRLGDLAKVGSTSSAAAAGTWSSGTPATAVRSNQLGQYQGFLAARAGHPGLSDPPRLYRQTGISPACPGAGVVLEPVLPRSGSVGHLLPRHRRRLAYHRGRVRVQGRTPRRGIPLFRAQLPRPHLQPDIPLPGKAGGQRLLLALQAACQQRPAIDQRLARLRLARRARGRRRRRQR